MIKALIPLVFPLLLGAAVLLGVDLTLAVVASAAATAILTFVFSRKHRMAAVSALFAVLDVSLPSIVLYCHGGKLELVISETVSPLLLVAAYAALELKGSRPARAILATGIPALRRSDPAGEVERAFAKSEWIARSAVYLILTLSVILGGLSLAYFIAGTSNARDLALRFAEFRIGARIAMFALAVPACLGAIAWITTRMARDLGVHWLKLFEE